MSNRTPVLVYLQEQNASLGKKKQIIMNSTALLMFNDLNFLLVKVFLPPPRPYSLCCAAPHFVGEI